MNHYYIPQKAIDGQRQKIDEINENIQSLQAKQWEEFRIQNNLLNKIINQQKLKDQIREKLRQKVLQDNIKKDIRKEVEEKNKKIEYQLNNLRLSRNESQKLYFESLKHQQKWKDLITIQKSRNSMPMLYHSKYVYIKKPISLSWSFNFFIRIQ